MWAIQFRAIGNSICKAEMLHKNSALQTAMKNPKRRCGSSNRLVGLHGKAADGRFLPEVPAWIKIVFRHLCAEAFRQGVQLGKEPVGQMGRD